MKLLVIDTSGPVCGTAVMDEGKVYSEFTAQNRHTHSASLMPMVERTLGAAGMALEALDESAGEFDGIVCPIQDARAGQVYGAAFRNGERLIPDAPMKLEEYLDTVSALGERFLFTGDGAPVFRERITEILGERAVFAPPHRGYLRPSAAGSIAIRRGETTDYLHLEASYLRPPNAQKNRKLLEAMRKNGEE